MNVRPTRPPSRRQRILAHIREGLDVADAAVLEGTTEEALQAQLDQSKGFKKAFEKAKAEFMKEMHSVVVDAAKLRRDAKSAQWLIKRKRPDQKQLEISFAGPSASLDMPSNGRLRSPA